MTATSPSNNTLTAEVAEKNKLDTHRTSLTTISHSLRATKMKRGLYFIVLQYSGAYILSMLESALFIL